MSQDSNKPYQSKRGFAAMDPERQREIASEGGRASHQKGTAHEFTSEEARQAGRIGGQHSHGGQGSQSKSSGSSGSSSSSNSSSGGYSGSGSHKQGNQSSSGNQGGRSGGSQGGN
ncbi:MAG: KGG domain-containing protein [Gallionellaceae bacterium]|nr:KGG domain-containing protein [Gallionellaceae bacterium]